MLASEQLLYLMLLPQIYIGKNNTAGTAQIFWLFGEKYRGLTDHATNTEGS